MIISVNFYVLLLCILVDISAQLHQCILINSLLLKLKQSTTFSTNQIQTGFPIMTTFVNLIRSIFIVVKNSVQKNMVGWTAHVLTTQRLIVCVQQNSLVTVTKSQHFEWYSKNFSPINSFRASNSVNLRDVNKVWSS